MTGKPEKTAENAAAEEGGNRTLDTAVSANFRENNRRFTRELNPFGDYAASSRALFPVQEGF